MPSSSRTESGHWVKDGTAVSAVAWASKLLTVAAPVDHRSGSGTRRRVRGMLALGRGQKKSWELAAL